MEFAGGATTSIPLQQSPKALRLKRSRAGRCAKDMDGPTLSDLTNQPSRHQRRTSTERIMTELEQLLITALAKQNEQVDAIIEQVGDLVTEQATMAEHVQRMRDQLRPHGIY